MRDTLGWKVPGEVFEDDSRLEDWRKIESHPWQWQYDDHELAFDIYEHDGQFWKLYRSRYVPSGALSYAYRFGGQACRMTLVEYQVNARSPHSHLLKESGDLEWVRAYEVDPAVHAIVRRGDDGSAAWTESA